MATCDAAHFKNTATNITHSV